MSGMDELVRAFAAEQTAMGNPIKPSFPWLLYQTKDLKSLRDYLVGSPYVYAVDEELKNRSLYFPPDVPPRTRLEVDQEEARRRAVRENDAEIPADLHQTPTFSEYMASIEKVYAAIDTTPTFKDEWVGKRQGYLGAAIGGHFVWHRVRPRGDCTLTLNWLRARVWEPAPRLSEMRGHYLIAMTEIVRSLKDQNQAPRLVHLISTAGIIREVK